MPHDLRMEAECFICSLQAASRKELAQSALASHLSLPRFCRLMSEFYVCVCLYLCITEPFVCNLLLNQIQTERYLVVIVFRVVHVVVLGRRIISRFV